MDDDALAVKRSAGLHVGWLLPYAATPMALVCFWWLTRIDLISAQYRTLVGKARALQEQGQLQQAKELLLTRGQPVGDGVVGELDRLVAMTQAALDLTQSEATDVDDR